MDSSHQLPAANRDALRRCVELGVPVVLATGKHRGPWVASLLAQVADAARGIRATSDWTLNAPGVFVQGLLVCDVSGRVARRRTLPADVVRTCRDAAERRGWTVLAYTGDDAILSNRPDAQAVARLRPLQEPAVEVGAVDGATAVHKMLFLADPADEQAVREEVASLVGAAASLTVAIPGMVEVLPPGTSKADGVRDALALLGVAPGDCIALGDGENDLEMLRLVSQEGGISVAVANARPVVKEAATEVVASCDEAGWAEAVERWALAPLVRG